MIDKEFLKRGAVKKFVKIRRWLQQEETAHGKEIQSGKKYGET